MRSIFWSFLLLLMMPSLAMTDEPITGDFPIGTRVEVDGRWDGEYLEAVKLVREETDEFLEIKGFLDSVDEQAGSFILGPFTILIDSETDFDDSEDDEKSHELGELKPQSAILSSYLQQLTSFIIGVANLHLWA